MLIRFLEKKIEQYEADLAQSKLEYEKPFAYETEYREKLARQCELNAQLDLENKEVIDADLGKQEESFTIAEDVSEPTVDYRTDGGRGR